MRMMPPEWPCGTLATSPTQLAGGGGGGGSPRTPFAGPRDGSASCSGSPFAAAAAALAGCKQEHAEAGGAEGVAVRAS